MNEFYISMRYIYFTFTNDCNRISNYNWLKNEKAVFSSFLYPFFRVIIEDGNESK